ncbi:MAG: hypothetical protein IJG47_05705 [Microbacterium sp.]|nr:hypothetical protein [Microbacterium sp.]
MPDFWITTGASALLAVLVAGLLSAAVAIWGTSRSIRQKSVIEQRQRWRDSLREAVPRFVTERDKALRSRLRDSIVLHLNPERDRDAIELVDAFVADRSQFNRAAVVDHFQVLLKVEWEKSKIEASLWPFCARSRAERVVERQRGEPRR